jgi:hypothetical protein
MGSAVRTAVLVVAIVADVFGGLGALAALLFGMTIAGLSGGAAGGGATGGALLALVGLATGIGGTVLATRRPRIGGALLVLAALLGSAGTFAFALGSLLYLIAGGMAFFVTAAGPTQVAGESVALVAAPLTAATRRRPQVPGGRRTWAIVGALVVALVAVLGGSALAQPAEQRPVHALLEALAKADDVALADLLAPELRSRTAARDAQAVLSYAFGQSELGFLDADWLRRLGPITGTTMRFENLTVTTTARTPTTAIVHVRGIFAPSNDNALMRLLLGGLRQPFDTDIMLSTTAGAWYVNTSSAPAAAASPNPAGPSARIQTPSAPPSTPALRHLALGTYSAPSTSTLNDIGGWRATLRDITVNVDESLLFEFDLTVGATDGPWAGRESRLELRSGVWLQVLGSKSTFYDGGKGPGATVRVALAFPPGVAGNQPYVLRICGNLGYCWAPLPGPALGER